MRFAIGDCDTGVSSLSYIRQLPLGMVTINGAFVRDMGNDPVNHGMVRTINEIAHLANRQIIAEFIKDQQILDRAGSAGGDFPQVYHLGSGCRSTNCRASRRSVGPADADAVQSQVAG